MNIAVMVFGRSGAQHQKGEVLSLGLPCCRWKACVTMVSISGSGMFSEVVRAEKCRTGKYGFTVAVLILCCTKIVHFLRRLCRILKKEVAYDSIP